MKSRLQFITALFGVGTLARAQHPLVTASHEAEWIAPWSERRPFKDQCPVCGLVAEPYNGEQDRKDCHELVNAYTKMDQHAAEKYPCDGVRQRITRCQRCNAAFWQDSVKKGTK